MTRKIGLLGGTFDPVHIAHLHVAACALHELGLDEVRFVPAGAPPHKPDRAVSPPLDRLQMLELATAGTPRLEVDPIDLAAHAPSYTSELLERVRARHPDDALWFIIGADSLSEFHTWHEPERIIATARLAVAVRPGWDVDAALHSSPVPALAERVDRFPTVPIDLSATLIRERIAADQPVDWLVPAPVLDHIRSGGLYRRPS